MTAIINTKFDAGNIEVVDISDYRNMQLNIAHDSASDFMQWFYFRVANVKDQACTMRLLNAHEATYPVAWRNYQALASYDRKNWFRVPTTYDEEVLTIDVTPIHDEIYFAYFVPYSYERHLGLVAQAQQASHCQLLELGTTVQGRPLSVLRFSDAPSDDGKLKCWFIARQHPGESMAEWYMEGLLQRLLDTYDPVTRALLSRCVFYTVPNMNPDGSVLGNLRTNAAGANLNREWQEPSMERSPEVYLVREKMHEFGVDFCLDVHGDEEIPAVFIAANEGNPSYNDRIASLEDRYQQTLLGLTPDFQTELGYAKSSPGQGNMTMATNYVGETFDCLAMTLEMPFKDHINVPDPQRGWSPQRCIKLAHTMLTVLHTMVDELR